MKKIFDISPPKKIERKEIEELPKEKPVFQLKKNLILIIVPLALIAGITAYFNLARAEIEIWPEREILTFKTKLTVDKFSQSPNFLEKIIPGKIFERELQISKEFPTSGKKILEKKAEGLIRIYNNYHLSQTLVAGTRFQPPLEKFQPPLEKNENPWFRIVERVTIPSKSYKDVKVIADGPGEKYNIPASIFSIPGLAGTPQYTRVYGESFQPMKGGLKKEVREVTSEDLEGAKNILIEKVKEELKSALRNEIPAEFNFFAETVESQILETFSTATAGAELEKFTFRVKAKAQTLVSKKADLENFAINFISGQIQPEKKIHRESLKINTSLDNFDLEAGKMVLSLNLEAKIYSAIDEMALRKGISGKSLSETKFFLENFPQITRVKIKFWPFWLKKVPEDIEKIKIKINLD